MATAVFLREENESDVAEKLHIDLLMKSLTAFFTQNDHLHRVLPIIQRTSDVSLRLLDWFIVAFAKEKNVVFEFERKQVDVYSDYRSQLAIFSKKYFDAFRRHSRIYVGTGVSTSVLMKNEFTETTIGQLCFFRWCLQNGIIDYVNEHAAEITMHMKNQSKQMVSMLQESSLFKQRKRKSTTKAAPSRRSLTVRKPTDNVGFVIKFD